MIVFSTNADEQTHACNVLIQNLNIGGAKLLAGEDAVKSNLEIEISTGDKNLYAMSHGKPDSLIDNNSLPAVDTSNAQLLNGRSIFAFACHTSSVLGKQIAVNNGNWFGYIGAIASPDSNEKGLEIFLPIFQYIYNTFTLVRTREQCIEFIEHVKELCHTAEYEVDQAIEITDELGLSTYMCLRNIWERLRVWLSRQVGFIAHKDATEPLVTENW